MITTTPEQLHKQRLDQLADAVIPEAVEWVSTLRAYRIYAGKNPDYFKRARIALGVVCGAIRLCATIENSRSNDLIAERLKQGPPLPGEDPKQIGEGA